MFNKSADNLRIALEIDDETSVVTLSFEGLTQESATELHDVIAVAMAAGTIKFGKIGFSGSALSEAFS